jgi:antitoxin (DNA-binding transcriptional repressor) of toxin-antitoxin stability system
MLWVHQNINRLNSEERVLGVCPILRLQAHDAIQRFLDDPRWSNRFSNTACFMYTKTYNERGELSVSIWGVKSMQETNVVELRKNIKHYFDAVESGEVVRVYRKGKPIAEILPLTKREASWKREVPRLTVPGLSLSREILKDRAESDT